MNTSSVVCQRQLDLLFHTLGLYPEQRVSNRNYFLASEQHSDRTDLEHLVLAGLMIKRPAPEWVGAGEYYHATEAGLSLALDLLPPAPKPKHSRYREWLCADVGDSFSDYLGIQLPVIEWKTEGGKTLYRYVRNRMQGDKYAGFYQERVAGAWEPSKKAAKASYKVALKAISHVNSLEEQLV